jgi:hypothetical protein
MEGGRWGSADNANTDLSVRSLCSHNSMILALVDFWLARLHGYLKDLTTSSKVLLFMSIFNSA